MYPVGTPFGQQDTCITVWLCQQEGVAVSAGGCVSRTVWLCQQEGAVRG